MPYSFLNENDEMGEYRMSKMSLLRPNTDIGQCHSSTFLIRDAITRVRKKLEKIIGLPPEGRKNHH